MNTEMPIHQDADGRHVASWEDPKVIDKIIADIKNQKQRAVYLIDTKSPDERTTLYGFQRPERSSGLHNTHVVAMKTVDNPAGGAKSEVETLEIAEVEKKLREGRLFIRDGEGHRLFTAHMMAQRNELREMDEEAAPAPTFG